MITVHQVNNLSADNANGIVTPINDRRFYNMLVGGESGVVEGCAVTAVGSTQVRVADGWGIIGGCLFTIEGETIDATLSASGTVNGRLLLQVDVAQSVGTFITQAAATLPALQQDDLTASGSIYQLELATYSVDTISISGVTQTFPTVESSAALAAAAMPIAGGTFTGAALDGSANAGAKIRSIAVKTAAEGVDGATVSSGMIIMVRK